MLANCTMSETLASVKVQADLCSFSKASKRTEMFLYTGIVYSVAGLLVALRVASKAVVKHLSMDDWLVLAALLVLALPVGCVLEMTKIGFGEHLWNLEDGDLLRILRFC
jgi:nitrate reductase gamma subunit